MFFSCSLYDLGILYPNLALVCFRQSSVMEERRFKSLLLTVAIMLLLLPFCSRKET